MTSKPAATSSFPVPEPDLTPAQMIERAKALRPQVRAGAAEAEKRGFYSEALHQAFKQAGFYRILQPRMFGGYEFDVPTFFRVMIEIATGDPGIGWCLCLGSGHVLQVSSYLSRAAQEKIFAPNGDFISPLSGTGTGPNCIAVPVEGGYRVSGTWRYCSGVPYSTHFMGLAKVPSTDGKPPQTVTVVVPASEFKMLNDWGSILGLRGSGSNSVVIEGTVIPPEFVSISVLSEDLEGKTPGVKLHGNPMYGGLFLGFAGGELVCSQVGAAKASVEEFERIIRTTRPRNAPHMFKYEHHDWQRVYGLGLSMASAAEAVLIRSGELYMEYCRRAADGGAPFTMKEAYQMQGLQHQASRIAWEAGLQLFRASSSTSAVDGQPMQRFFRDLATFQNNANHQPEFVATRIAQASLGLPIKETDL